VPDKNQWSDVMQISKKVLVVLLASIVLVSVTLTYALVTYYRQVPTTFQIVSSYNIGVVDAVSGANWTSWDIGTKHRTDFPVSSGAKNVTWNGDAPNGIYLRWNATGFDSSVTVSAEYFNGAGWAVWDETVNLPMGQAYPMHQVRFSLSVLSSIPDGNYTGTIYLNAEPK